MKRFVTPRTFMVGYTTMDMAGLKAYLEYTDQTEFLQTLEEAAREGVEAGECLVSTFAKLCYKSLVVGKNENISMVRDIPGNIKGIQKSAHGSVLEHVSLNFIVTNCSRVFTHELVRHRVGTAFSQTSGRYCRIAPGELELVLDPILQGCEGELNFALTTIEMAIYGMECKKAMRKPPYGLQSGDLPYDAAGFELTKLKVFWDALPLDKLSKEAKDFWEILREKPTHAWTAGEFKQLQRYSMWVPTGKEDNVDFSFKKKLTSALRRIAPNGQSNEVGVSLNVRTLRHTIMMRTSRHSEWEIRVVFGQIYRICQAKWPLLFSDAKERDVEGLTEVYGMKMAPYERELSDYENEEMIQELKKRIITNGDKAFKESILDAIADCDEVEEFDNSVERRLGEMEEQVKEGDTPTDHEVNETVNRKVLAEYGIDAEALKELQDSGAVRIVVPVDVDLHVGSRMPFKFPDIDKMAEVTNVVSSNDKTKELELTLYNKEEKKD